MRVLTEDLQTDSLRRGVADAVICHALVDAGVLAIHLDQGQMFPVRHLW